MTAGGLLVGKRVLVTGIATAESIAYATAVTAMRHGADVVVTALPRDLELTRETVEHLDVEVIPLDATRPDDLAALGQHLDDTGMSLDGALHAIAFAPKRALGSLLGVASADVELAFRTSVHSYVALAELLADAAPPRGASLVGLDFAADRAWATYNWMGVCKAALESANRYVARELGPANIRANLVAAGPLETRAASAIPGFDGLLEAWEAGAPMAWDAHDPQPVADAVCFLMSDLARAVTGEILNVDGGYHAMAAPLRSA